MSPKIDNLTNIAIIGPGPVGLMAALALAKETNASIALFGPKPTLKAIEADTRTTAFMPPSLRMLENLDICQATKQTAAPLKHLTMIDDCNTLLRAPDCYFSAHEVGLDAFAQNIPNKALNQHLLKAVEQQAQIKWVETAGVTSVTPADDDVEIKTDQETWRAQLVIGADGRNSICRSASAIKTTQWSYDQTAIACAFTHELPHEATSIELHRETGPLTLIPLKEYHASLVWSASPQEANRIMSINDHEFCTELTKTTHAMWGKIKSAGKRTAFPINGMKLNQFAAKRIFLIGEAAHVVPPIGAQGLNLGLRDIAHLTAAISKHQNLNQDLSSLEEDYNERRKKDVWSRTTAIDLLNKSLLISFLPLKIIRTVGLNFLNMSKFLRTQLMQQGLGEEHTLPPLMQDTKTAAIKINVSPS